jgi:SAM-dependent methyltransferase
VTLPAHAAAQSALDRLHEQLILTRRVRVLVRHLARTVPSGTTLLDVGSGDGAVAHALMQARPDVRAEGIDVLVREGTHIPVRAFDGRHIPLADGSVGTVLLVDVLHHADDPASLLREAARVARDAVIVKDHLADGVLAVPTLRFMDRVGNARHGVRLPYRYLRRAEWNEAIAGAGLRVDSWEGELGLYPRPAGWIFDRGLHFLARLAPAQRG